MAVRLVVTFNAAAGQGAEQVGLHIDLFTTNVRFERGGER
jgi:hypothetical protein